MGKKHSLLGIVIIFITLILQTTVLDRISFRDVKPDFVLIMIILISNYLGSIKGQLIGFFSGLVEDFFSLSPFGFSALIKTVIGYLSGKTESKIFLDPIVVPIIFVFTGTIIKSFLSFILILIFSPEKAGAVFSIALLIEIGLNIILTPLLYFILKLVRVLPSSNSSRIL